MSEASVKESTGKRASAWRRFWRGVWLFILWLIRLIIAIGAGVLLGAAIFYIAYVGVPQFYSQVLSPIQVHTAQIAILQEDLRSAQASMNAEVRAVREENRALRRTINDQQVTIHALQASLETEKANREQFFTLLQQDVRTADAAVQVQGITLGQLEAALQQQSSQTQEMATSLSGEVAAATAQVAAVSEGVAALEGRLEERVDANTQSVSGLESQLTSAVGDIRNNASTLALLSADITSLGQELMSVSQEIETVMGEVDDIRTVITMPISLANRFERRLVLMQGWQEVLRARTHLLERNQGLASQALELAYANVARFISLSTDLGEPQLAPIQARMETAAANIDEDPFVAVQELEIIWHSLGQLIARPVQDVVLAVQEEAAPEEAAEEEAVEEEAAEEAEEEAAEEQAEEEGETEEAEEGEGEQTEGSGD